MESKVSNTLKFSMNFVTLYQCIVNRFLGASSASTETSLLSSNQRQNAVAIMGAMPGGMNNVNNTFLKKQVSYLLDLVTLEYKISMASEN